jgi:putative spermidine/putrescine transport system permease protein
MTAGKDRPFLGLIVLGALARSLPTRARSTRAHPTPAPAIPAILVIGLLAWGLGTLAWRSIHAYDSYTDTQGPLSLTQFGALFAGGNADYYRGVLLRTVVLSVFTTIGAVAMAVPVAYYIVRAKSNGLRLTAIGLCLVPFLMGDIVRAFGWLLLLGRDGAYGWMTQLLGGDRGTLIGTSLGVILGSLQTVAPVCVFILLPAVRRIDPDIEKAAQTLGARPGMTWRRVTLPLMRPGIVGAAIVAFALTMTQYAVPDILGGGRLPFAANAIQSTFFSQGNIYLGSALAVIVLVMVLIVVGSAAGLGRTKIRRHVAVNQAEEECD